ncbi:DUF6552 family protein [Granulosicoccus sp. 3-233]|uniref:DUF6552 family protein n=1 Tax=Granulosicoccus sp. 3-233 TaxID=3417969 RepID=UPI003D324D1B
MPPSGKSSADRSAKAAFIIKWVASVMQILGYTAIGFDLTPWNAYLFLGGVGGWLIVGVLWNDRGLMLIHAVALVVDLSSP